MKKLFALALAAALMLTLAACNDDAQTNSTPTPTPPGTSTVEPTDSTQDQPTQAVERGPVPEVTEGSKYTFVYSLEGGQCKLPMNQEFTQLASWLGEPVSYFEAASCAFDGLDKTYNYPGIELVTYPVDGVDYISDIYFTDDTVATPEGIKLGSTLEEMLAAYGEDYTENFGQYSYTDGDTILSILVEDGAVAAVEYLAINGQLAQ